MYVTWPCGEVRSVQWIQQAQLNLVYVNLGLSLKEKEREAVLAFLQETSSCLFQQAMGSLWFMHYTTLGVG